MGVSVKPWENLHRNAINPYAIAALKTLNCGQSLCGHVSPLLVTEMTLLYLQRAGFTMGALSRHMLKAILLDKEFAIIYIAPKPNDQFCKFGQKVRSDYAGNAKYR
jgi:hypothetical protein